MLNRINHEHADRWTHSSWWMLSTSNPTSCQGLRHLLSHLVTQFHHHLQPSVQYCHHQLASS